METSPVLDRPADAPREVVAFRAGGHGFCVDIMAVREIRGWTAATALPHAPAYVRGVINLRGAVLSIVDLAARLGFDAAEPGPRHVIIVVQLGSHAGAQIVGLLVDAVSDILTLEAGVIQPTPDVASAMTRDFVRGVVSLEDRLISLITLDRLLPPFERAAA